MAGEAVGTSGRRPRWQALTGGGAIFQEDGFRRLWIGRAFSHSALNAVLFTLLVLAVGEGSGSSIKSALFVTAYILPTATLGTISGVLVDRIPKNLVLAGVNIARLGLMLILVTSSTDLWTIYGIALLLAVTTQFGAPAEAAALPQVVRPDQLTTANSMSNLGALVSQVVGFAVLPPLFLNTVGPRPLFFVAALFFGAGAVFFLSIQHLGSRRVDIDHVLAAVSEVRKQFAQAWETLGNDLGAYVSVIIVVLASTASLLAVTVMPRFTQDVLDIPVQNAIFVFLPAGLGVLVGLRLVQFLESRLRQGWLIGAGFCLFIFCLAGLALTKPLAGAIEGINPFGLFDPGPLGGTTARVIVAIAFSTAATFSFAVVGVASRSLVNERMPMELQGRIFAAQYVLTNLASIPPILLVGLLAEVFGVAPVMLLFLIILLGIAGWTAARAAARPRTRDVAAG